MSEQRKEERKTLISFTPVYDFRKNILMGYLRDLTLRGAMLEGNRPVEVDHKLLLAIEFHETPEIPATRTTILARVVWCNHVERSIYYNTGFEFVQLTDENKKVLGAILERYQFRQEPPA